jgi:hypothetical protein
MICTERRRLDVAIAGARPARLTQYATAYNQSEVVKTALKTDLSQRFSISHSTLEFEETRCDQKTCQVESY